MSVQKECYRNCNVLLAVCVIFGTVENPPIDKTYKCKKNTKGYSYGKSIILELTYIDPINILKWVRFCHLFGTDISVSLRTKKAFLSPGRPDCV